MGEEGREPERLGDPLLERLGDVVLEHLRLLEVPAQFLPERVGHLAVGVVRHVLRECERGARRLVEGVRGAEIEQLLEVLLRDAGPP